MSKTPEGGSNLGETPQPGEQAVQKPFWRSYVWWLAVSPFLVLGALALASCAWGFMSWVGWPRIAVMHLRLPQGGKLILERHGGGASGDIITHLKWVGLNGRSEEDVVSVSPEEVEFDVYLRHDNLAATVRRFSGNWGCSWIGGNILYLLPAGSDPLKYARGEDLDDADTLKGYRPIGGCLQLSGEALWQGAKRTLYANWRAPKAAGQSGTSLQWVRRLPSSLWWPDRLIVESRDNAYREGEWRRFGQRDERYWMVDHAAQGGARVAAALDLERGLFYDEAGMVWRIPEKPGRPMTKVSDKPQPYPEWATVMGGKSITPWRASG